MAKPDWGELQQRFLSEHAATGVSPKEWCEAQGLKRYRPSIYQKTLRKLRKNLRRKNAHCAERKSANELVDDDGLTAQQRLFVAEYLKDNNATQAAIRAGYSKKQQTNGYQLFKNFSCAGHCAAAESIHCARLAVPMKCLRRCGSSPPSMQTSFRSIAAARVVTAGASVTSTSGAMLLSLKRNG
jgi:hypothetical protein